MGADGVVLSYGRFVQSDTNERYPLTREGTSEEFLKTMQLARDTVGDVMSGAGGSSGANGLAYIFKATNRVLEAPELALDAFGDQPVPVYHIATQGLITRYSWAPNLRNDQRTEFLRMIEYGMYPDYWLTHQPSADLIRTTNSWLYSTEWTDWLEPAAQEMLLMRNEFGPLHGQFITAHDILEKGVHRVTYEDGTQLIVNHNTEPFRDAAGTVEATGYVLRKGGAR
jgi:hypothetical protein